ncbi:hypothetical protein K1719_015994 [Acacia pycnantha]|nr:hypothetical protein K1719_015994 [Acacia pycnantha]
MMEEELQRMKEASQSDPSTAIQAPQRPPRHKKWKAARMKGDKYINEDVAAVASKIDILSTVVGKSDYPDAVRGETRGVSVAKFFGRRSRFGLKTYRELINAKEQGGPKWFKPTCHQQPGSTECRYYVMSWMQSIVNNGRIQGFQNFLGTADPYSQDEIDSVRDMISRHLLQHIA